MKKLNSIFLLSYLNVIFKLGGTPVHASEFYIFSDNKSFIVTCNVEWISQEFRGSEFYNMDMQDMVLDDITRKQLIWYGHVERMDPMLLPKIMIHWKPEGRKKRGHPRRTWKDGIYTAMNERDLRMGEWNN